MAEGHSSGAEYWDLHARRDPLWAVLSESGKEARRWDLPAFMATGEREISILLHHLVDQGLTFPRRRALDFGCGVGRLAQALGRRFDAVLGIDISPRMIELARRVNRLPAVVSYQVHASSDLQDLASPPFDFIYSNIVLQHIEPATAAEYVRSFVRCLSPEGLLVFQLPSHRAPERVDITPMPAGAYSAKVRCETSVERVQPAAKTTLSVQIENRSAVAWAQDRFGSIRLGNHWCSRDGEMLVQDDGRAALPSTLEPGSRHTLTLAVRTPAQAGEYILELDLVHEGVTWFKDRGSDTASVSVSVGEAALAAPPDSPAAGDYRHELIGQALEPVESVPVPGDFPMHAIPRETTLRIIGDAGGAVVLSEEDDHARPDWISYRYVVRRA